MLDRLFKWCEGLSENQEITKQPVTARLNKERQDRLTQLRFYEPDGILVEMLQHEAMRNSPPRRLADRELIVAVTAAAGMSLKDQADLLQVAPKTISKQRENIRGKLNLPSRTDLVYLIRGLVNAH